MKKTFRSFVLILLSLILSCFMLPKNKDIAKAEQAQEKVKYSLIGSDFNLVENTVNEYNIQQSKVSNFTPFDLPNGVRMSGNSFSFVSQERNQINNQYVKVDDVLVPSGDNSLFIWIYFDTIFVHNLTITLELDNSATISWEIGSEALMNLVKKTTNVSTLSMPYSWNQIEMPFNLSTIEGEIYNQGYLRDINKLIVNFTSPEEVEDNGINEIYSSLLFYDIYISESTKTTEYSVEKQNYRFYKIDFYSQEFIDSLCLGDQITLPQLSQAVKYAWNGQIDLKNTQSTNIAWSIMVKTPDDKNSFLYPSFGDKLTLSKEGVYEIFIQCKDLTVSNTAPIMSDSIEINVNKLCGVYFEKPSYEFEVGKTYIVNVYTSSKFSSIIELKFSSNSNNLIVENNDNGTVSIRALKDGKYTISATVKGKRAVSNVEKEYTEEIKVKAYTKQDDSNRILKIMLYVSLGIGILVITGFLIKKVVDNRKYTVK